MPRPLVGHSQSRVSDVDCKDPKPRTVESQPGCPQDGIAAGVCSLCFEAGTGLGSLYDSVFGLRSFLKLPFSRTSFSLESYFDVQSGTKESAGTGLGSLCESVFGLRSFLNLFARPFNRTSFKLDLLCCTVWDKSRVVCHVHASEMKVSLS